jgi:nicotinamide-nucleotide amidase
LYGVSLPCSSNKEDEINGATLAGREFCNVFIENNIQDMFKCLEDGCDKVSTLPSTPISQGNIKARLRMILLYDIASKMGGVVIDNDMLTEHYLGFMTINGDVFDISPLANLWKTEVYELAKYMRDNIFKDSKAFEAAINIVPTDGNGVSNSDLDQIMPNYTYYDVDKILMPWVGLDNRIKDDFIKNDFNNTKGTVFEKLINEYGKDNVKRVIMRSVNSEFKRYPHPIPIDIFKKEIVKKL